MKRSDVLLLLIEEHSSAYEEKYWVPSAYPQYCSRLKEQVTVYGAGDRAALNSLLARRLIERSPNRDCPEFYRITEDGLLRAQTLA